MKAVQFSRWMAQLSSLNPEQRDQLRSKLLPAARHSQDAIK
ncbi:IS1595 family transposase, partial [Pseudomonas guguanensis]|nr:IS1595 family transposase [Pseudomonas guguanensis]MDR8017779.1 IS1595 family transposase [Pseudomonas guguanensis]